METLGLAGERSQEDGFFRSLFWPTVQNHYDVSTFSRRGFWLASVVGFLSGIVLLVQAHPVLAAATLVVFLLGACGIREKSTAASVLVLAIYMTGVVFQWVASFMGVGHIGNPVVSLVCIAMLASCARATVLSRKFLLEGDHEVPEDHDTNILSKFSNHAPPLLWPKTKYVFFALATLYLVVSVVGYTRALIVIHKAHTTAADTDLN